MITFGSNSLICVLIIPVQMVVLMIYYDFHICENNFG